MADMVRTYFSVRTGRHKDGTRLGLVVLCRLFKEIASRLGELGYLEEAFGKDCPDAEDGVTTDTLGRDIGAAMFRALRKDDVWPIYAYAQNYKEDDLFDVIEFLYDHVSQPVPGSGWTHNYAGCGQHHDAFVAGPARIFLRDEVNGLLSDYSVGYELTRGGEVVELAPEGVQQLLDVEAPSTDSLVRERIASAVQQFRRRGASQDARRIAVRELADVLEHLKPTALSYLTTQDSKDLFNLANNFGIRHLNDKQKSSYDHAVWLSWMFYHYLATIYACLHLERGSELQSISARRSRV